MTELVCAWNLAAGDLFPGGESVVSVGRDESSGRVWVADDDGAVQSLPGAARLVVIERGRDARPPAEPPFSPRERFNARRRLDAAADKW